MKLLILGHGRHGKDTVAEMLQDLTGLTFCSSSLACAEKVVYPALKDLHGYHSVEECFNDRHNHRDEWKRLISAYNYADKARLAKEILAENDCYVGMRSKDEYNAAKPLFDHVVWVDAGGRLPDDPTMTIQYNFEMIFLDNNRGLKELEYEVRILAMTRLGWQP